MLPKQQMGKQGNYDHLQFMRGRPKEKTLHSNKATNLGCAYGCLRVGAVEQTPTLMRPQTLIIRTGTLVCQHTHKPESVWTPSGAAR